MSDPRRTQCFVERIRPVGVACRARLCSTTDAPICSGTVQTARPCVPAIENCADKTSANGRSPTPCLHCSQVVHSKTARSTALCPAVVTAPEVRVIAHRNHHSNLAQHPSPAVRVVCSEDWFAELPGASRARSRFVVPCWSTTILAASAGCGTTQLRSLSRTQPLTLLSTLHRCVDGSSSSSNGGCNGRKATALAAGGARPWRRVQATGGRG